ncbi:MAG TPA: helix-turn-helix transcriptional regulator [Candidatus Acidoferrales bacterium]|nr:helix-turn-helix transcriptional regulator [Candidatus Acidoferrales bacterium]
MTGPDELVFWHLSLQLEHLFPLFESGEICLLQNIFDGLKTAKLYPAASAVAQESCRRLAKIPAQVNLDYRCHLLQVAAAILTVEFNRVKSQRVGFVRPEEHMVQVFEKLTAFEMLNLSVGELADRFGCSRRHLNRLFHHYFGVSVAALRMEMRLLRSVTLLRDPDAKVIRVAEDCGFNQLCLFNTCFKRRFGASPGQWRKMNMEPRDQLDRLHPDGASCLLQVKGLCPLSDHARHPAGATPFESSPIQQAQLATLSISSKGPNRNVRGERPAAASQKSLRPDPQKRILVRINV